MHSLITHPDQREKVLRNPALLESAVEEILRFAPAVHLLPAHGDGGHRDPRAAHPQGREGGDVVPVGEPRRGRLPRWRPLRRRPRQPNDHLAFGIGEHFCLGASLARLELQVIFKEILTRLPDMELAAPPRRLRSNFVNGCKEMRVQFTPES